MSTRPTIRLVAQLREDLVGLESALEIPDLRTRIQSLLPAFQTMQEIGASLVDNDDGTGARRRILTYFLKYPGVLLPGIEIALVSGISEWARRIRELRINSGWPIAHGLTVLELQQAGELPACPELTEQVVRDSYMLLSEQRDGGIVARWKSATTIGASTMLPEEKLATYLAMHVGTPVTSEELRQASGTSSLWATAIRSLRVNGGWPITSHAVGRPDLPRGNFILNAAIPNPEHDRGISDVIRSALFAESEHKCQICGWSRSSTSQFDVRYLDIHRTASAPIAACNVCHDAMHY